MSNDPLPLVISLDANTLDRSPEPLEIKDVLRAIRLMRDLSGVFGHNATAGQTDATVHVTGH